jgi:DNA-binding transcriptional regulator YdaS (Cro superfamily)
MQSSARRRLTRTILPPPVDEAINRAGGLQPLADACEVTYQAVQRWRRTARVPAERVLAVEAASGVARERLRPDLYPRRRNGS